MSFLAILLGPLGKLWGLIAQHPGAAAMVGLVMAVGIQTLRLDHSKADLASLRKADAAAAAEAAQRQKASQAISAASQASSAAERVQIVTRYKTLAGKVVEVSGGVENCSPSSAWIELWNAAARP